jgi:hypothetical protein
MNIKFNLYRYFVDYRALNDEMFGDGEVGPVQVECS